MIIKSIQTITLLAMVLLASTAHTQAAYKETMDPDGPVKNLRDDYGLVDDNAAANQSEIFQKAIDELAAAGGGRIILPKGTYQFGKIQLRSNIHILIEKDTLIKLFPETKSCVFLLDAERPSRKKMTPEQDMAFIENVSIRGIGGRYTIDYSDREASAEEGIRAITVIMARNFLVSDLDVKDNYTKFCGIDLYPTASLTRDVSSWEVTRPTDGTIRNCRIFNASPMFGLSQAQGARSVHYEDIYAEGGITLRLETGLVGFHTGIFNVTAKNVTCENGNCAVLLGPHSAKNGLVQVENVTAKGCAYAVQVGIEHIKPAQFKIEPDATTGSFAEGSYIKNIHAVFGKTAQVKTHEILMIPEEYFDDLKFRWLFNRYFEGPSIGAVMDSSEHFKVQIENITMDGFKYYADKPILNPRDGRPGKWWVELRKWEKTRAASDEKEKSDISQ
jgi:hypothetical protein